MHTAEKVGVAGRRRQRAGELGLDERVNALVERRGRGWSGLGRGTGGRDKPAGDGDETGSGNAAEAVMKDGAWHGSGQWRRNFRGDAARDYSGRELRSANDGEFGP